MAVLIRRRTLRSVAVRSRADQNAPAVASAAGNPADATVSAVRLERRGV